MNNIVVIDNLPQFVKANADAFDRVLNLMAIDIERLAKTTVPFKHGPLKASGRHLRIGYLNYIVEFNKVYAAYQEWGGDATRTVKHYTTPGTGKFYLRDSGKAVAANFLSYVMREIAGIKV